MRPYQIEQQAKDMEISFNSACAMRIRYLFALIASWNDYIDEQIPTMPPSTIMDAISEICDIRIYQQKLKKGQLKPGITNEHIQQARDYPIEKIIEFERGLSIAFCHTDKRPSLTLDRKRNRAHCFPCDKDFSALDVLIERDGLSFLDAVKQLTR
jgi:hypothetical protein